MGRYTLGLIKGFSEQDQRVVVVLAEDLPGLGEREAVLKSVNPNVEIYTISLVSGVQILSRKLIRKTLIHSCRIIISKTLCLLFHCLPLSIHHFLQRKLSIHAYSMISFRLPTGTF